MEIIVSDVVTPPERVVDVECVFGSGNTIGFTCTEDEFNRRLNGLFKMTEPGEEGPMEHNIAIDVAKLDYWRWTIRPLPKDIGQRLTSSPS